LSGLVQLIAARRPIGAIPTQTWSARRLVNKIDLLPQLDFDLEKFLYHLDAVHPGVEHMLVSARAGEGIDQWREWLLRAATREPATE